ncbi:MAG: AarF/ABC1/UbiB kinase family protein [Verrucomicrobiota bacterium]
MIEQDSISTTRLTRMAALAGTGARVGINYLKHYGKRAISGGADHEALQEKNAAEVFRVFSQLKGGPLKMAQMLSIDQGLLPPAFARQFSKAQYSATPLSYPLVSRTFRREFGKEPLEMFDEFSRQAAHGASIGQVHKARLDGRQLAVKVQYPGVAESLRSDLRLIKPIALQVLGLRESDVALYFAEVETRLLEETNYALELERSVALSSASAHLKNVRFPAYYPSLCSSRILTMDWVEGVPLDRFADGPATQDERDRIGQALWDFYAHQIHDLRLFHADPHPGNFLIRDAQVWVLDFGCTKAIGETFHHNLFRLLDPALQNDPQRLDEALRALDILLEGDDAQRCERLTALCLRSLELLARPLRSATFDFADPSFMASIYEFGEANRQDDELRSMRGRRGSADSIYLNRAYFGLYSLLSRLRARVQTSPQSLAQDVPPC